MKKRYRIEMTIDGSDECDVYDEETQRFIATCDNVGDAERIVNCLNELYIYVETPTFACSGYIKG